VNKIRKVFSTSVLVIVFILTLHLAVAETPPFAFVALGDQGCGCKPQQEVADKMIEWYRTKPYKTVILLGDTIYGSSVFGKGGNPDLFDDRFDRYYQPLLNQGVKFYATIGNHDAETNRGRPEIADKKRFNILGDEGYYSFSPGPEIDGKPLITFFVLNSERLLKLNADPNQIAWLSRALTESKAIWKVAYFHHPIYAPTGGHKPEGELKQGIENILRSAGVQMVLAGHDHYYARMKPQGGVTYFVTGGGGRDLITPKKTDITVVAARQYHFMYFEVFTDQIAFVALPPSGPPLDQGMIMHMPAPVPEPS
jgi:3',5'-cyclic AMP phosphodiesterase CpdA